MLGALSEPAVERPSSDAGTPVPWAVSYPPMLCAHCASPLPDGGQFCTNCGADVRSPSSSSPASLDDAGVAKLTRVLREDTAGEYEIERELARGGMGVVYLATETQLRRRVAIKVLPPALTFGEGAIEPFRREARTAAGLDHPAIIPIYRVSTGGELLWYSMKLLEGKSLDTLLKERVEALAFEQLHRVPEQLTARGNAVDGNDGGMVESRGGAGFAPERLDGTLAEGERGWEHLDGHAAPQLRLRG